MGFAALRLPFFALAGLVALSASAQAGPLPKPAGEPILTVTGKIANTNEGEAAVFDREMLEAIGKATVRSQTPWYDKPVEFEGVPMKALMEYVGADGAEVTATALNDYQSTVPMADFDQYGALLAMKRDGETMPIRDKGPLWLVYPYDSNPDLSTDKYYSRSVWQIKELNVQ